MSSHTVSIQRFVSMLVLALGLCIAAGAKAAVAWHTADGTNAVVSSVGLSVANLNDNVLNNPSALSSGSNNFSYVAVLLTPQSSGSMTFGLTSSPVDTVMILYQGVFNSTQPGLGAIVGNDDTPRTDHQAVLGSSVNTLCGSSSWCPQITANVTAGQAYTLLISTYSTSTSVSLPVTFYSSDTVTFTPHTPFSTSSTPIPVMPWPLLALLATAMLMLAALSQRHRRQ